MLSGRAIASLLVAAGLAGVAARAGAQEPGQGLRRPERITVGVGDDYLGQLAPDGRTLYFVSNRNTANEIYRADVEDGRVRLLFDEGADVTWPRIAPDGRSLLYISFRDSAAGQLCVRDLPGAQERRCLDTPAAALQAEWIGPGRIAVVSRETVPSDLAVLEVTVGTTLSARPLLRRNLTSPALSPDGRWLVYVPVERYAESVGPAFAARAANRLEAVRLGGVATPIPLPLDLPGLSGQPAFGPGGTHLYFVQFLGDSNRDGVIDANDHGVLFRVPFFTDRDDAPSRAADADPEQLTEGSRNCQYPAPGVERVVFTCARGSALSVYGLPLDGEVPAGWTAERIGDEIDLASRPADALLLYRHLLARARTAAARASAIARLVRLHLQLDEFAAAAFYARKLASLPDPDVARLSEPLLVLVEHRQALHDREHGRSVGAFTEAARRRFDKLRPTADQPAGERALRHVIRSEIADTMGDKAAARAEIRAAAILDDMPQVVLEAWYRRADALYRELDDREALVAAARRLASSGAFDSSDQLPYARATVRALTRGLPRSEADAVLARERAAAPDGSELAFALDLGRCVLAIHDAHPPPAVREALFTLYRAQQRPDRRRAVILEAVRRAAEVDADTLIERLVQLYVQDVGPGTRERRRAERLYLRTMMGRAYRHMAQGRLAQAREEFDAVTRVTGSLETVVASVEVRLRSGESLEAVTAGYEESRDALPPATARFVTAYLLARSFPRLDDGEYAAAAARAKAELRAAWRDLSQNQVARALLGAIWQEEHLRTGSLEAAQRANVHFLVALESSGSDPRLRAMLLGQLGLLHTQVGNYRIALRYLEDREKLPFADNAAGVAVKLSRARALLHVDREEDAATEADEALAMVGTARYLEQYRLLALDRAALCNLAADRFQRALELYDAAIPILDATTGPAAARNRMVMRLARAAAALGAGRPARTLEDLDAVDAALRDPAFIGELRWPHAEPAQVALTYRLVATGLRANATRDLGQPEAASVALEAMRSALTERFAKSGRDEDLRQLTLAETRLADNAAERKEYAGAARWIARALDHADSALDRTHASVGSEQLTVLWFAAELGARGGTKMPFDVSRRLQQASDSLAKRNDRAWRSYQRRFEIYQTLMEPAARVK